MSQVLGQRQSVSVEMLQDNQLFRGVEAGALQSLLDQYKPEIAQPGDWIMREGGVADYMFVIINGELEVVSHGGGTSNEVRVALLGPGDWVGEMAVLDPQAQRSASVRSLAPSLLLRLTVSQMQTIEAQQLPVYAAMVRNIARELSRRLRVADRLIARTSAAMAKQYVIESMRPAAG
jgi:CRP/FNR family transcriptional regulator, cyclic AMP receptor protein